ncbi:sensor histidine kinase [Nocardioides xinjiangensis]|uniref:sensor histidine kinase n=1 Tax=Nocardioides xinjiangensis TaxID=2817376 RepID=UPI001B306137|nr:HAMP domain-containing sensor histidine kinase [Nocardioides sp. SYSU D00778]
MSTHPALQDASGGAVSGAAGELATAILQGEISPDDAIVRTAAHFMSEPRVEVVAVALTSFTPEATGDWARLGGRAWVRQWVRPGSPCTILPSPDAGPEAALSMPWLSKIARHELVVLTDRDLLPPEAEQDRSELARVGVQSLIASTFAGRGTMFGSLSVGGRRPGPWDERLVQDFRLLNAAILSRLTLEQSRRALAEAIAAGAEAQEAYQQFFGAVGHELRTPLSAILGYTEVLIDEADQTPADPVSGAMLRDGPVIVRACEQLLGVVDSLLGAGRTLAGDEERQDVLVADAVADVVHWHRVPAGTARVALVVDVDPDATVRAHPSGVRQALSNLVGNAITHHRPAGGEVHLTTERLLGESGQEMVRIIVRDDGPGLTPGRLEHVFDPFVRYAEPTVQGSGLGLPMARTIAERDGGAVRGESTAGVGSSFWLELPVRDPAA